MINKIDKESLGRLDKKIRLHTLANGIRISHVPVVDNPQYFLGVIFATGTRNEKNHVDGISHFLEHMMFRGSKNYPSFLQLADAFEWLGGEWNAETGYEHTEYIYSGHINSLEHSLMLFAEFLHTPLLLDLELEREVILREIEDELNEFGHSTDMDWHMSTIFWPNSQMSAPITGDENSVKSITNEHLQKYRQQLYAPENMAFSIVGGQDSDEVFQLIEKYFSDYHSSFNFQKSPYEKLPSYQGPQIKFVKNSDNQHQMLLSFLVNGEWSEDRYAYDLIGRILADGFSSRLPVRLREELGLVYDVSVSSNLYSDTGTFDIMSAITPDRLGVLLSETLKILMQFVKDGPTAKELEKAKMRSAVSLTYLVNNPEGLGFRNGWSILKSKELNLANDLEKILAVSIENVKEISAKIFDRKNLGLVILGDKESKLIPELKVILKNYTV